MKVVIILEDKFTHLHLTLQRALLGARVVSCALKVMAGKRM